MHHERLATMAKDLTSGRFGPRGPTAATASFCFRGDDSFFKNNIRVKPDMDALGCVGDLGWYCVRLGLFAFGWALPTCVSATINASTEGGVPLDMNATLLWKPPRSEAADISGVPLVKTLTMSCSFLRNPQQWCVIAGAEATMMLDDFVIPKSNDHAYWMDISDVKWTNSSSGTSITELKNTYVTDNCRQEVQMWLKFCDCVAATSGGAAISFWPGVALATQLVIDALMESAKSHGLQTLVDPTGLMEKFAAGAP
jgi:hypothetical protein